MSTEQRDGSVEVPIWGSPSAFQATHTLVHFKSQSQKDMLSSLLQDLTLLPLWPWYFLSLPLAATLFSLCFGSAGCGPT